MNMDTFDNIDGWLESCKAKGLIIEAHQPIMDDICHSAACETEAGVIAVFLSYLDPLIPDFGLILHPPTGENT